MANRRSSCFFQASVANPYYPKEKKVPVNLRPNLKPGVVILAFALAIAGAWLFWNAPTPAIAQTQKAATEVLGPNLPPQPIKQQTTVAAAAQQAAPPVLLRP